VAGYAFYLLECMVATYHFADVVFIDGGGHPHHIPGYVFFGLVVGCEVEFWPGLPFDGLGYMAVVTVDPKRQGKVSHDIMQFLAGNVFWQYFEVSWFFIVIAMPLGKALGNYHARAECGNE